MFSLFCTSFKIGDIMLSKKFVWKKIVYFSELCLEKSYSFQAPMSGFVWKNAAIKPVGTLMQIYLEHPYLELPAVYTRENKYVSLREHKLRCPYI